MSICPLATNITYFGSYYLRISLHLTRHDVISIKDGMTTRYSLSLDVMLQVSYVLRMHVVQHQAPRYHWLRSTSDYRHSWVERQDHSRCSQLKMSRLSMAQTSTACCRSEAVGSADGGKERNGRAVISCSLLFYTCRLRAWVPQRKTIVLNLHNHVQDARVVGIVANRAIWCHQPPANCNSAGNLV